MKTSPASTPTSRHWLLRGLAALLGLGVLFAASSGPVYAWSARTGSPSFTTVLSIYAPLGKIARVTGTDGALIGYVNWWLARCEPADGYKYAPQD